MPAMLLAMALLPAAALAVQSAEAPGVALRDALAASEPAAEHVLARLVVIGASVSHGFRLRVNLADALHASIAVPHELPLDGTLDDFFGASMEVRSELVEQAVARQPTAVVAVDFLFWFANSSRSADVQREHLDRGLPALDAFVCPVVTSLLPDMSTAPGFLFASDVMPRGPMLVGLNERIAAWAAARPNVTLVPLPETMEAIRQGQRLPVGGWSWTSGSSRRFLQPDGTHPTEMGLVLIACLVDEALRASVPGLDASAFESDKDEIHDALLAIRRVRDLGAPERR